MKNFDFSSCATYSRKWTLRKNSFILYQIFSANSVMKSLEFTLENFYKTYLKMNDKRYLAESDEKIKERSERKFQMMLAK